MREFWVSSGHHLTPRLPGGGLAVSDELLLTYLARPELMPPPEACESERRLHAGLQAAPRRPVSVAEIAAIADDDARENWAVMLAFRERLMQAASVEAAYLGLVRGGAADIPPLFLDQLAHLVLRNALDGCEDPFVLRAGELFFRPQRASTHEGALLLADAEVIDAIDPATPRSPLLAMFGYEPPGGLDILEEGNAWTYWSRSDAFTMALNIGTSPKSRAGLARAIEAWIRHLMHVTVDVEPIAGIEDQDWRWFVGLDAEATRIGNALWRGEKVGRKTRERIVALFRATFRDAAAVAPDVGGHPVYLILAMDGSRTVRLKPQNLVAGLPLSAAMRAA